MERENKSLQYTARQIEWDNTMINLLLDRRRRLVAEIAGIDGQIDSIAKHTDSLRKDIKI